MPSYIEENMSVVMDSNPKTYKPILFTNYEATVTYNLTITYEDSTTKTIELVQGDRSRPYRFVFKKDGQLITAIGVPKIYPITENCKFCDFVNRTMDSNDLLIELDCSEKFDCTKYKFYLKDVRDIIDLSKEPIEDPEDNMEINQVTMYPIYLNDQSCMNPIKVLVNEDGTTTLAFRITKQGQHLAKSEYSDFDVITVDFESDPKISIFKTDINTTIEILDILEDEPDLVELTIPEELIDTELTIIARYFINEINHPVFDEFTIVPVHVSDTEDVIDESKVLARAVTTQDTQYLGDGLKPALGVGLTPGYKEYRNKKSYDDSVLE